MNSIHKATLTRPVRRESSVGRLSDRHGLRAPGLLGRHPIIGLLMIVIGGLGYGAIAISLQTHSGPLSQLDAPVNTAFHTTALQSPPFLRDVMILGFYVGEHFILAIGLLLAAYFLYKRFWPELSMVVIAWAGEGSIWLFLTQTFNRPRPSFDVIVWHTMNTPSFPSGHTISVVMCYGLLAYLLTPKLSSRFWKIVLWLVAVFVMVYVGVSRLFVGDHYLTDVLAGYALGIAWSGLVYTGVELITQKRIKRHVSQA